jgi:hypothetical protein
VAYGDLAYSNRAGGQGGTARNGEAMTRKEIEFAYKRMKEEEAYSLRLILDNQTTVFAHDLILEPRKKPGGVANDPPGAEGEIQWDGDDEGLLWAVKGRRRVLIAVSRIVAIEMVPFGWP